LAVIAELVSMESSFRKTLPGLAGRNFERSRLMTAARIALSLLAMSLWTAAPARAQAQAQAQGQAQAYPAKPIRVVVPFPPGGLDVTARVVTNKMSERLGQPLVIENRAGANGVIGSEQVARSAPDGHTLLITTSGTMVTSLFLSKSLPFQPQKDFTPVGNIYQAILLLAVNSSVPVNSLRELIDYAKKNPGKLNYGSIGTGSAYHLNGEILKQMAGIDIVHIPYGGSGPLATALLGGQVELAFPSIGNLGGNLGKVKVLAFLDPMSHPRLPGVPHMAETIPGFRKAPNWIALFGPAGLPQPVLSRLSRELKAATDSPDVRAAIDRIGSVITYSTPEELADMIKADIELTARLVKAIGLQPE
jgi:tripartite-type tricarboxylate transporter receptor subunit TctC